MADPVEKHGIEAHADFPLPAEGVDRDPVVIEYDLLCRACGYNLRGLSPRGGCPECEMPVAHALHGDWLRYSDPRWVATIARGYRLQSGAVAIGLLAIIFAAASARSLAIPWLTMAIALTVGIIALLGVWLTTAREPAAADIERWHSDRKLLRVFTIAGVVMQAGSGFFAVQFPSGGLSVRLTAGVVMIFGILCAFRHAIALADRIPDYGLVSETRAVMWGLILSYGSFLAIIAFALTDLRRFESIAMMAFGLSCTVIVGCVIFTLWSLTLFSRYAAAMRTAAMDAEYMAARTAVDAQK